MALACRTHEYTKVRHKKVVYGCLLGRDSKSLYYMYVYIYICITTYIYIIIYIYIYIHSYCFT